MKAWQLSLIAVTTASTSVYAVQPQGVHLGSGVTMLPGVEIGISSDSNIYLSASDETSSRLTFIRPSLGLVADLGTTQLNAYYQLESGAYAEDSDDNYLDQLFVLGADLEVTSKQALGLDLKVKSDHDPRGAGSTQGVDDVSVFDIDEFKELVLGADYTYGANTAFANVTGYLESFSKTYSSNKDRTESLEHDKLKMGALLALRVTDATRALVEVRNTTLSYSKDNAKDGSELKFLAGARWGLAAKTTGEIKLGLSDRKFDKSDNDADSRFSWEANVTWSPRSYSIVNFVSSQRSIESAGDGSHVAASTIGLGWMHQFSTRFALEMSLASLSEEYVNSADNRDDNTVSYGVGGIFSPNTMFDFKLGLEKTTRSSKINTGDYDRQVITLGVELAI